MGMMQMVEMRNDREVYNIVGGIIKDVINDMAEYILGLIEVNINQIVYGSGNIPKVYDRTWEFLNSWMKTVESSNSLNEVVATIFSEPSKMHCDKDNFIHGSKLANSGDMTAEMSMLIEEGLAGNGKAIFGTKHPGAKARPFFSATVKTLNRNGFLLKMFKEKMAQRGLEVKKTFADIGSQEEFAGEYAPVLMM